MIDWPGTPWDLAEGMGCAGAMRSRSGSCNLQVPLPHPHFAACQQTTSVKARLLTTACSCTACSLQQAPGHCLLWDTLSAMGTSPEGTFSDRRTSVTPCVYRLQHASQLKTLPSVAAPTTCLPSLTAEPLLTSPHLPAVQQGGRWISEAPAQQACGHWHGDGARNLHHAEQSVELRY